jgi:hypothetical protein
VTETAVAATSANDDAAIDERIAPDPAEPEASSLAAGATASAGELTGASPKAVERADMRPAEPVTTREHDMLDRRFASWTGRLAPGAAESRVAWKQNGQAYTAVFHQQPSGDPMGHYNKPAYAQGNYEVVSARCAEGSGELLVEAASRLLRELAKPK